MQILKPKVEYWGFGSGTYEENLRLIERAGRVCYKSEDKIGEGTAEPFVKKLIKVNHLAMVEHSNFVVKIELSPYPGHKDYISMLQGEVGSFLNVYTIDNLIYVGGNLTAWWKRCEETEFKMDVTRPFLNKYIELFGKDKNSISCRYTNWTPVYGDNIPAPLRRYTMKFTCDRGVSHELVRHRLCSFAQESTRYCNYKNQEMQFIEPWWYDDFSETGVVKRLLWQNICRTSAMNYRAFLDAGGTPQGARAMLPNSLKTEVVVTADMKEWEHIFKLRCDAAAHPDMVRVMKMARESVEEIL